VPRHRAGDGVRDARDRRGHERKALVDGLVQCQQTAPSPSSGGPGPGFQVKFDTSIALTEIQVRQT
jgi:hypothetical protein